MVITCPSCSARYRLNPDKIKGRGAKITCPKCSHIFVVFSDQGEKSSPGSAVPDAPLDNGPNTAGDALAARDRATTTGAFKAVGVDERGSDPAMTASGKIRVVAPGPRKGRRRSATTFDSSASLEAIRSASVSTVAPVTGEVPAEEPVSSPGAEVADIPEPKSASELDFREVGITTWKVKVAIGLIYDFSDISTLKKYLADKKVTEDDLISHNAKDWVRIGDIENLDRHFIETWKIAKAEKIARGSSVKVKKPASDDPAASGRFSATGAAATDGSTGSFAAHSSPASGGLAGTGQTRTRKARRAKAPEAPEPRAKGPFVLAALILVGIVGYFLVGRPAPVPVVADSTANTASATASDTDIGDAEREAIRERIRRDMEEQRRQLEAQEATPEPTPERVLEPVTPPRVQDRQPGKLRAPIREVPSANRPDSVADAGGEAGGKAEVEVTATDSGGKMYFDKAKQLFTAGNFGTAKSMVKKAIQKDDTNGSYYALQGDIHTALGEPEAAAAAYAKAESLGTAVNRAGP